MLKVQSFGQIEDPKFVQTTSPWIFKEVQTVGVWQKNERNSRQFLPFWNLDLDCVIRGSGKDTTQNSVLSPQYKAGPASE